MALTRSLNRVDLPVAYRRRSRRPGQACSRFRSASSTRSAFRSPMSIATSAIASATRRSSTGSARPTHEVLGREAIEVSRTRRLPALSRPTSTPRSRASAPTYERQLITPGRPAIWIRVDYYPDRGSQGHVRGFLVTLQRRRSPEAARARSRTARASPAPRDRQRRPADPLLRPPAQASASPTSRSATGSACRPTTCSATR